MEGIAVSRYPEPGLRMGFNLIDFRVYVRRGSEGSIQGREKKTCLRGLVSEAGVLTVFAFIITNVPFFFLFS